jgi:hypothetical protein
MPASKKKQIKRKKAIPRKINRDLITKAIRQNAFVQISKKKKIQLNISPEFYDEYIDRIFVGIEINIQKIAEKVYRQKGRKTLMVKYDKKGNPVVDDVTDFFSRMGTDTMGDKNDEN